MYSLQIKCHGKIVMSHDGISCNHNSALDKKMNFVRKGIPPWPNLVMRNILNNKSH